MPSLDLRGPDIEALSQALRKAFPIQRLRELFAFRLDKRLEDYSLGGDYKEVIFDVIMAAEAEGWTAELVVVARQSNPGNAALQACAERVHLGASTPTLERIVKADNPFLDVERFRTRLGRIETQVCRIEIPTPRGTAYGTGFLVAPDVLVTNHHVMDVVIGGQVRPEAALFRFDYKRLSNDVVTEGVVFRLAPDDWLVDASPPSPVDAEREPKSGVPNPDELDYAIVRLTDAPGSHPAGDRADPSAPARGWIDCSRSMPATPQSPLLIMQHPSAAPLKLALDMRAVVGQNANGTRLTYNVNTEGGSSGAPCFDANWDLVALHHSGDPNFDPGHQATYNEGIPIGAILQLLEARGKRAVLAAPAGT